MNKPADFRELACGECLDGKALGFDISMAFQPIVDVNKREIYAHEALVRGVNNEPAGKIFEQVNDSNRYLFDQTCRVKAIGLASTLGMNCLLSINFMPNAVYRPELCIRTTLAAADRFRFPIERIIFEVTEGEKIQDNKHLGGIIEHYQQRGFLTAIDDFGAGYSGLNLLAEFKTDLIKLDMGLLRNIDTDRIRQSIVKGILQVCEELNMVAIAEGIETRQEFDCLRGMGIYLFQGYYFARPQFEGLAEVPVDLYS